MQSDADIPILCLHRGQLRCESACVLCMGGGGGGMSENIERLIMNNMAGQ